MMEHEKPNGWRGIPLGALRTRRAQFLAEADRLFPWQEWEYLIEPHYPKRGKGRPPYPLRLLLRLYLLRQWFGLSDQAAQEVAIDSIAIREFLGLGLIWGGPGDTVPDETTILNFRRMIDRHKLAQEIATDIAEALEQHGWKIRAGKIEELGFVAGRVIGHNPG